MNKINFLAFFIIIFFVGCSSISGLRTDFKNTNIEIKSPQAANIYLVKGENVDLIGQAPLSYTVPKSISSEGKIIELLIEAAGHIPIRLYLDSSQKNIDIEVSLKIFEWWNNKDQKTPSIVANKIIKEIQQINLAIKQNKVEDAKTITQKLLEEFPYAAVLYDIMGSLAILSNKREEAVEFYEKSLKLDPTNVATSQIIKSIKQRSRP